MPASIQLIAPPFHEKLLYRVGSAYENIHRFHREHLTYETRSQKINGRQKV